MDNNRQEGAGIWQQLGRTQAYITWAGYAFENNGAEVTLDKTMAMDYRNKMAAFKETTRTRKQVNSPRVAALKEGGES